MHVTLMDLWMPIVVSAVIVFVASAIVWMVLPHHKPDFKRLPNEDAFLAALRAGNVAPGQYIFPWYEPGEMKDPAKKKRYEAGPLGVLLVWGGCPNMGRNLGLSFIFYLVVGVFVAYLASHSLPAGAEYLRVFQVTGTAAIMAYCFASIPHAIWFGKPLRSTATDLLDGVVYGLLTAGTFGWLWPAAASMTT